MSLQNDDVQDFDVRWYHALLTVSEMLPHAILEGLYESTLKTSVQLQTVMTLCDQEVARYNGEPNYQKNQNAVKIHVQMMRNPNFRVRNDVVDWWSVTKGQKGNKAYVERKVEECFLWKRHGQCSKGDYCSFSHDLLASGNKGKARASESQVWKRLCTRRQMPMPTCWAEVEERWWRSLYNRVVCLKILIREILFCVNLENWEQNAPSDSPGPPGTKPKFGKERVHREDERSPCAPKFEEKSQEETVH